MTTHRWLQCKGKWANLNYLQYKLVHSFVKVSIHYEIVLVLSVFKSYSVLTIQYYYPKVLIAEVAVLCWCLFLALGSPGLAILSAEWWMLLLEFTRLKLLEQIDTKKQSKHLQRIGYIFPFVCSPLLFQSIPSRTVLWLEMEAFWKIPAVGMRLIALTLCSGKSCFIFLKCVQYSENLAGLQVCQCQFVAMRKDLENS